jgi:hypothetical protein
LASAARLASKDKKVDPPLFPDLLELMNDAADGYPASRDRRRDRRPAYELLRSDRKLPVKRFGERGDLVLLFKNLATLRTDTPLFKKVEKLRWRGATPATLSRTIGLILDTRPVQARNPGGIEYAWPVRESP